MKKVLSFLVLTLVVSSALGRARERELNSDDRRVLSTMAHSSVLTRLQALKAPELRTLERLPTLIETIVESLVSDGFKSYEKSHGAKKIIPVKEFENELLKISGGGENVTLADFKEYLSKDGSFIASQKGKADELIAQELKFFKPNFDLIAELNKNQKPVGTIIIYNNNRKLNGESIVLGDLTAVKHSKKQSKWPQETKDYYLNILSTR
ncbi:MAG: hypothetical protein A4S09_17510 [Proteobacteria bacterium SG_bin7]|nr:MAG: hypothetical protein A4S09_17510 [Proteobacteria bacterium SG_bin7]